MSKKTKAMLINNYDPILGFWDNDEHNQGSVLRSWVQSLGWVYQNTSVSGFGFAFENFLRDRFGSSRKFLETIETP